MWDISDFEGSNYLDIRWNCSVTILDLFSFVVSQNTTESVPWTKYPHQISTNSSRGGTKPKTLIEHFKQMTVHGMAELNLDPLCTLLWNLNLVFCQPGLKMESYLSREENTEINADDGKCWFFVRKDIFPNVGKERQAVTDTHSLSIPAPPSSLNHPTMKLSSKFHSVLSTQSSVQNKTRLLTAKIFLLGE